MNLQQLVDAFNQEYVKASYSSSSVDWMEAALIGRQIVNELVDRKQVSDKFLQYNDLFGEQQ